MILVVNRNVLLQFHADELLLKEISLDLVAVDFVLRHEIDEDIVGPNPQRLEFGEERRDRRFHLLAAVIESLAFVHDAEDHHVFIGFDVHQDVGFHERAGAGRRQFFLGEMVRRSIVLLGPGFAARGRVGNVAADLCGSLMRTGHQNREKTQ